MMIASFQKARRQSIALSTDEGVDGAVLTLRGLSLSDVSAIRSVEEKALAQLYLALACPGENRLTAKDHIGSLLEQMPTVAARIIAQAADIPEEWSEVMCVPFGTQIEALEITANLTFESDAPTFVARREGGGVDQRGKASKSSEQFQDWHWGLRKQVSLLLDHGHPQAADYPIGMVSDEARLVEERTAAVQGVTAVMTQMAVSTVPNMGVKPTTTKRAMRLFQNTIKMLTGQQPNHG